MINLVQNADGSAGMQGRDLDNGKFIPVVVPYVATTVSNSAFTAARAYVVQAISGRVETAGTGGACTFSIYKTPSGTAGASGVLLHTGTFNLVGTAATVQNLALSATASALLMAAGDSIYVALTGTATSAVGSLTVTLCPA